MADIEAYFGDQITITFKPIKVSKNAATGEEVSREPFDMSDYDVVGMRLGDVSGEFEIIPEMTVEIPPAIPTTAVAILQGGRDREHIAMRSVMNYRIILNHKTIVGRTYTIAIDKVSRS